MLKKKVYPHSITRPAPLQMYILYASADVKERELKQIFNGTQLKKKKKEKAEQKI